MTSHHRMPKKTKAEKELENRVAACFRKSCSGIQVSIFDLGSIMQVGKDVVASDPKISDDDLSKAIFRYVSANLIAYPEGLGDGVI